MTRILIVEDEADIQELLDAYLRDAGYDTALAGDGIEAAALFQRERFDLVLLDVMLPKLDGFTVLRRLRAEGSTTPVLMLTALTDVPARVRGLDAGADDYLAKPFASAELIARVRALLRRSETYVPDVLTYGDLSLDCSRYELGHGAESVRLNNKEFRLMELFMRSPRRVYSTERLLELVWGWDSGADSHVVWTNIANLRRVLRNLGASERIRSVRGEGYSLEGAEC